MEWVEVLAGTRVIVGLPEAAIDDLIAAGEVLVQEGLTAWTVPVSRHAELPRLRSVFGGRVRLGWATCAIPARSGWPGRRARPAAVAVRVRGRAAGGRVDPDRARRPDPRRDRPGPGARSGGGPGDAVRRLGSLYARTVTDLFAGEPLIATGKLERFQCEMWLDAGALAVCPVGLVGAADVADPDLADLRRRARAHRLG
ncbi:MAG: hypothetical protein R2719_04540 [Micropruina sp.]